MINKFPNIFATLLLYFNHATLDKAIKWTEYQPLRILTITNYNTMIYKTPIKLKIPRIIPLWENPLKGVFTIGLFSSICSPK